MVAALLKVAVIIEIFIFLRSDTFDKSDSLRFKEIIF
jgi:hypothetical protein